MNVTLLINKRKAPAKLLTWATRTLALVVYLLYGGMPARLEGAPQNPMSWSSLQMIRAMVMLEPTETK